jgi:thiol-disulfide isomerase/thioredoxin
MHKFMLALALTVAALVSPPAGAARCEELTHSGPITGAPPPAADSKIEVLEFFMWTCPHCMQFEPHLKEWLAKKPADVDFVKVPAVFNPTAAVLARAYYALEALGEEQRLSDAFFNALIKERRRLPDEDSIAGFVASTGSMPLSSARPTTRSASTPRCAAPSSWRSSTGSTRYRSSWSTAASRTVTASRATASSWRSRTS